MIFDKMTWKEIEAGLKKTKTVIVPVSPLEEHGPHLPVSTDYLTAYEIAKRAEKKTNIFLLPPIIIGVVNKGYLYPGSVSLSKSTFANAVYDICKSLSDTGFRKIIFLSGHWGGTHVSAFEKGIKRFLQGNKNIKIILTSVSMLEGDTKKQILGENIEKDKHAGEIETSRVLELSPKDVRKGKLVKEIPNYYKNITPEEVRRINKTGIYGDATKATKEKGKKLAVAAVKKLVTIINGE